MTLDAEDDAPIQLHIASPDGDLGAALVLADTVDLAAAPITATCRGALGGPALARASGQPADKIAADMETGRILTADQARDYGLIHEITGVESFRRSVGR